MNFLKIAHRGYKYKDNSINSIRESINYFDIVEIDVQITKDENIILLHDIMLDNKYVKDLTLKEILEIDPDICTLNYVLSFFPLNKKKIYIDIKDYNIKICYKLIKLLNDTITYDYFKKNIFLCSFNLLQIEFIKRNSNLYTTGFITSNVLSTDVLKEIIKSADVVVFECYALNSDTIHFLHNNNKKVMTYTCKNDKDILHISNFKVDGIVSDILL